MQCGRDWVWLCDELMVWRLHVLSHLNFESMFTAVLPPQVIIPSSSHAGAAAMDAEDIDSMQVRPLAIQRPPSCQSTGRRCRGSGGKGQWVGQQ